MKRKGIEVVDLLDSDDDECHQKPSYNQHRHTPAIKIPRLAASSPSLSNQYNHQVFAPGQLLYNQYQYQSITTSSRPKPPSPYIITKRNSAAPVSVASSRPFPLPVAPSSSLSPSPLTSVSAQQCQKPKQQTYYQRQKEKKQQQLLQQQQQQQLQQQQLQQLQQLQRQQQQQQQHQQKQKQKNFNVQKNQNPIIPPTSLPLQPQQISDSTFSTRSSIVSKEIQNPKEKPKIVPDTFFQLDDLSNSKTIIDFNSLPSFLPDIRPLDLSNLCVCDTPNILPLAPWRVTRPLDISKLYSSNNNNNNKARDPSTQVALANDFAIREPPPKSFDIWSQQFIQEIKAGIENKPDIKIGMTGYFCIPESLVDSIPLGQNLHTEEGRTFFTSMGHCSFYFPPDALELHGKRVYVRITITGGLQPTLFQGNMSINSAQDFRVEEYISIETWRKKCNGYFSFHYDQNIIQISHFENGLLHDNKYNVTDENEVGNVKQKSIPAILRFMDPCVLLELCRYQYGKLHSPSHEEPSFVDFSPYWFIQYHQHGLLQSPFIPTYKNLTSSNQGQDTAVLYETLHKKGGQTGPSQIFWYGMRTYELMGVRHRAPWEGVATLWINHSKFNEYHFLGRKVIGTIPFTEPTNPNSMYIVDSDSVEWLSDDKLVC